MHRRSGRGKSRGGTFPAEIEQIVLAADHRLAKSISTSTRKPPHEAAIRRTNRSARPVPLQHLDETARGDCATTPAWSIPRDERRGAARPYRDFRPSTSIVALSTPMPRNAGEHMFGGGDQRTLTVAEHRCKIRSLSRFRRRLNLTVAAVQTGADKNKTCIHWCRSKG